MSNWDVRAHFFPSPLHLNHRLWPAEKKACAILNSYSRAFTTMVEICTYISANKIISPCTLYEPRQCDRNCERCKLNVIWYISLHFEQLFFSALFFSRSEVICRVHTFRKKMWEYLFIFALPTGRKYREEVRAYDARYNMRIRVRKKLFFSFWETPIWRGDENWSIGANWLQILRY